MKLRSVLEGDMLPWGYGIAWHRWERNAPVIMPIPFNVIAGWVREVYFLLAYKLQPRWIRQREVAIANKAFEAGRRIGRGD